jgi:hypothetical protein
VSTPTTDHTAVFGPIPNLVDIWDGVVETLRTWLPTYLRERERLADRPYGSLPSIRSWRIFAQELDAFPADQLPLCVVVAPGLSETPTNGGGGRMAAELELDIAIVVASRSVAETLRLAGEYGAAARTVLLQHRSLGGRVSGLRILSELYNGLGAEDQRTMAAVELGVAVRIDRLANADAGPAEPFPDPAPDPNPEPGGPSLGWVETTHLDLEREP